MPVSENAVIDALRPVEDPELHRSIVELDMVRAVEIEGADVTVLIALTVAGCPLKAEITSRVTKALMPIDGIDRVRVDMTVMTPEELEALREKMQRVSSRRSTTPGGSGHSDHADHGHGPAERAIPFGRSGSSTRVIGVSSGKGGVGKSSVTVNLAASLAALGYDVAVLDADVYGFSVPSMLGITEDPGVEDEMIVPPSGHGVRCISMSFFLDEDKPVMWRGPMLHKALHQFLVDVHWDDPDFLVIDMPPGTGDVAMSMAQYVPNTELYVVTTPQRAAHRVARRSGAMARELGLSVAGVIENMSWFVSGDGVRHHLFGEGGGGQMAEALDVPLVAQIPLVPALREGADMGVPIVVAEPDSEVAFVFAELAHAVEKAGPRRVYRQELRVR